MPTKKNSFEEQIAELENIVNNLENGNVPLEQALENFKKGVKISTELQKKLATAEETVTKLIDKEGNVKPFDLKDATDDNE